MSQPGGDMSGDCSDEDDRWDEGTLLSGSDSGCSVQSNDFHRVGGLSISYLNNGPSRNPQRESPDAATRLGASTASTSSTAWDFSSYSTHTESGISSISPRTEAARQPRGGLSESPTDSMLSQYASHSTSTARQISSSRSYSTLHLEATDSESTGSGSLTSNTLVEDDDEDTPDTSEADFHDGNDFGLDEAPPALILDRGSLFAGLEFPPEYRRALPSSVLVNSENDGDDLNEIPVLRTNPQARPDAASWLPTPDTLAWSPDPVEVALAPSPGPAYDNFYSPMRQYTWHDGICPEVKAITASLLEEPSKEGSPDGNIKGKSKSNSRIPLLFQYLGNRMKSRYVPFQTWHNTIVNLEWFRENLPYQIDKVEDVLTDPHYQIAFFHPGFLVSHLSSASVSKFSAELCPTNSLALILEDPITLSLGFGPHISLQVLPFVPNRKEALRSFRKREGKDYLDVQDSLPIALDLLSIESTAESIDDWLDGIIDSPSELSEYLNIMMRRHKRNLSVNTFQVVISWILESRSKLCESASRILRTALKLLLTTSILSMVPRVTSLSSSLLAYLSLDSSAAGSPALSLMAPKMLTRQIKACTYHLQGKLLLALFTHFNDANERIVQVRLSVALIVSFVLELVRGAGRQFARYAQTINNSVSVEEQQVKDYERNIEGVVFERIRASIYDSSRGAVNSIEELGERLRGLSKYSSPIEPDLELDGMGR